jgi:DNA polymerase III epsilon subunit-like protein
MKQVMLDIETLGREPGCAVMSIGAVKFGPGGLGEEFYRTISLESCALHELTVETDTLSRCMLEQGPAALKELNGDSRLEVALTAFIRFYGDADEVWANSPSFDCEILEAAYEAAGLKEPWGYYEERDHHTLRKLPQAPSHDEIEDAGTEHKALNDAKYQARQAYITLDRIGHYE